MPKVDETAKWTQARLISTRGLRNVRGQEAAATSAVLAVMAIIPSFNRSLLRPLGAPAGRPVMFTEPSFSGEKGDRLRPERPHSRDAWKEAADRPRRSKDR